MRTFASITMLVLTAGLVVPGHGHLLKRAEKSGAPLPAGTFQTGDIILRTGKGIVSDMFRNTSLVDKRYSHAGVICVTTTGTFVVHIIGPDDPAQTRHLRMEPVDDFCRSGHVRGFAVFRYPEITASQHRVETFLSGLYRKNVRFDESFDLTTSNELYCTELIHVMFRYAGVHPPPLTEINGRAFASLDQLYLDTRAVPVYKQINN